jgi:hypothetical protein
MKEEQKTLSVNMKEEQKIKLKRNNHNVISVPTTTTTNIIYYRTIH